jgi:hypothetical protein
MLNQIIKIYISPVLQSLAKFRQNLPFLHVGTQAGQNPEINLDPAYFVRIFSNLKGSSSNYPLASCAEKAFPNSIFSCRMATKKVNWYHVEQFRIWKDSAVRMKVGRGFNRTLQQKWRIFCV